MDYSIPGNVSDESRRLAVVSHLGILTIWFGVPGFAVPLIIWLMERHGDPWVERHAREALNFQITAAICTACIVIVMAILWIVLLGWLMFPVLALLWLVRIVFSILGALRASENGFYEYPITLRLV